MDVENFISTIIIGFLAAILGSWVALRKFKKEKLWERKEKSYSEIIDALYALLQHCEVHKEDFGQGTGLSEDRERELAINYNQAFWKIKKVTDIGAFVISAKAHKVLVTLMDREKLDWNNNPRWELYENDYQGFQQALNEIVKIASRELNAEKV